jgi:hypothetical protein
MDTTEDMNLLNDKLSLTKEEFKQIQERILASYFIVEKGGSHTDSKV